MGYAVINLGIGLGMMFLYETTVRIAVANILSYPQWGAVFSARLYASYSLLSNNWTGQVRRPGRGPHRADSPS